jgi:cysteine-rich repeat protein
MKRRLKIFALIFLVLAFSVAAETVNFEMGECVMQDVGSICPLIIATDSDLGTLSLTGASFNLISTTAVIDDVVFTNGLQDISVGNDYTFFGVDTSLVAGDQIATIFVTTISTPLLVDIVPITAVLGTGDDEVVLDEVVGGSISNSVVDSDGDGVSDAEDTCPGFDDNIDAECMVNTPPEINLIIGDIYYNIGSALFDFSASSDDGSIASYELTTSYGETFGEECVPADGSSAPEFLCKWLAVGAPFGENTVTLTLVDDQGLSSTVTESFIIPACGDGTINAPETFPQEECDDGNNDAGDGCSATCTEEFCLDGECDISTVCDSVTLTLEDGETLGEVRGILGDADLPAMLSSGSVLGVRYTQEMSFGPNVESGFVDSLENDNDVIDDFLFFKSGSDLVTYVLEFETPIGFEDLAGQELQILGEAYDVLEAKRSVDGMATLKLRSEEGLNLWFTDKDFTNSNLDNNLVVNREVIQGAFTVITGTNAGSETMVTSLNVIMQAQDDYFVGIEKVLSDAIREQGDDEELLLGNTFDVRLDSYDAGVSEVSIGTYCEEESTISLVATCGDGFCTGQEVCASDCTFTTEYENYITWVDPNDGILIVDRNEDGVMQDQDFFGYRPLVTRDVDNGFEDLALFDSNGDGVINEQDEKFSEFQIWQDLDSDGFAIAGELFTLEEAGVAEVRLSYRDNDEEYITQKGTYKSIEAVRLRTERDEVRTLLDADPDNIALQERFLTLDASLDVENTLLAGTLGPGSFLILDLNNDGLSFMNCMSPTTVGTGCLVPECGNYGLEGDEECDSEDEFARGLCVLPGSADECRLVTINTAEQALNQILCVLDAARCEGEIYTIEEQKLRVRDLFLMFLRGIGGEQ